MVGPVARCECADLLWRVAVGLVLPGSRAIPGQWWMNGKSLQPAPGWLSAGVVPEPTKTWKVVAPLLVPPHCALGRGLA